MVSWPEFPIETDDPEMQKKIEASEAFGQGKIWIMKKASVDDKALEGALAGLEFDKLRKMAALAGHRDVQKYSKVELLDILEREGF